MKYIPGHSFTVKVPGALRSMASVSVRTKPSVSYGQFRAGHTYTIVRTKPVSDGIEYTFSHKSVIDNQQSTQYITEKFDSPSAADQKIDSLSY